MIPETPRNPILRFRPVEYRVPEPHEWFWPDGDVNPVPLQFFKGMDLSWHNEGKRWILERIDDEEETNVLEVQEGVHVFGEIQPNLRSLQE